MSELPKGWIGVDLDGTLALYDEKHGMDPIGEPIPKMLIRVQCWLESGQEVRIFTARVYPLSDIGKELVLPALEQTSSRIVFAINQVALIRAWCQKHFGQILPITCKKDFMMIQLWDDRAVQVIPNTGDRADGIVDV